MVPFSKTWLVIMPEKDDARNDVEDDNGIKVMVAVAIKGVQSRASCALGFTNSATKLASKASGMRASSLSPGSLLAPISWLDGAHKLTGVAATQSDNQQLSMKLRLLNSCFTKDNYKHFIAVNNKRNTKAKID